MSPCIPIKDGFLTVGGPTLRLSTSKGVVAFEWHDYCGPMPVKMQRGHRGDERVLPESHPFWAAVTRWCDGGRVVDERGWCVVPR